MSELQQLIEAASWMGVARSLGQDGAERTSTALLLAPTLALCASWDDRPIALTFGDSPPLQGETLLTILFLAESRLALVRLDQAVAAPPRLRLDLRDPALFTDAHVWVIGHSQGELRFSIGHLLTIEDEVLGYDVSAEGGSLGSAVLSLHGDVVGVHVLNRGIENNAVRIAPLLEQIRAVDEALYTEILSYHGIQTASELRSSLGRGARARPDPVREGLRRAAAVLWDFHPDQLQADGISSAPGAAWSLLWDQVETMPDGRWRLTDDVRRKTLAQMGTPEALRRALAANEGLPRSEPQRLLDRLVKGEPMAIEGLAASELHSLDTASRWLRPVLRSLPDPDSLARHRAATEVLRPLRELAGDWFRGRETELARLREWIDRDGPAGAIAVTGPGGVGKSAMVAALLLERVDGSRARLPFAWLDFDRPALAPTDAVSLFEEVHRQLVALKPEASEAGTRLQEMLRQAATDNQQAQQALRDATSDIAAHREHVSEVEARGRARAVAAIADFLREAAYDDPDPSLVLVLDSYEEIRPEPLAPPPVVVEALAELQSVWPELRVLLLGRADIVLPELEGPREEPIQLVSLDEGSCRGLLSAKGVDEADHELLIGLARGNPLTLVLAADFVKRHGASSLRDDPDLRESLTAELVQGVLYRRILDHIGDPDLEALAHPGLALRRITVPSIQDVLAGPCGLGAVDAERGQRLFEGLARIGSLVHREGEILRHRPDVRQIMVGLLEGDRAAQVAAIDQAAAAFYAGLPAPQAWERAEGLYHRLRLGQLPGEDEWTKEIAAYFGSTDLVGLSEAAAAWLKPRLAGGSPSAPVQGTAGGLTRLQRALRGTDPRELEAALAGAAGDAPQARYLLGLGWLRLGQYERVLEILGDGPHEPRTWLLIAEARERSSQVQEAVEALGVAARGFDPQRGPHTALQVHQVLVNEANPAAWFPEAEGRKRVQERLMVIDAELVASLYAADRPFFQYAGALAVDGQQLLTVVTAFGLPAWTRADVDLVLERFRPDPSELSDFVSDGLRLTRPALEELGPQGGDPRDPLGAVLLALPRLDVKLRVAWLWEAIRSVPELTRLLAALIEQALRPTMLRRLRAFGFGTEESLERLP